MFKNLIAKIAAKLKGTPTHEQRVRETRAAAAKAGVMFLPDAKRSSRTD